MAITTNVDQNAGGQTLANLQANFKFTTHQIWFINFSYNQWLRLQTCANAAEKLELYHMKDK